MGTDDVTDVLVHDQLDIICFRTDVSLHFITARKPWVLTSGLTAVHNQKVRVVATDLDALATMCMDPGESFQRINMSQYKDTSTYICMREFLSAVPFRDLGSEETTGQSISGMDKMTTRTRMLTEFVSFEQSRHHGSILEVDPLVLRHHHRLVFAQ